MKTFNLAALMWLSLSSLIAFAESDVESYMPKRNIATTPPLEINLPDAKKEQDKYVPPGALAPLIPDKNPFSEVRRIIKEKGNITQQELSDLANSVAPPPTINPYRNIPEPPPNTGSPYRNPVGSFDVGEPHPDNSNDGDDDSPYLFGLDKKTRAKELMDMREDKKTEESSNAEENGSVLDKYIEK